MNKAIIIAAALAVSTSAWSQTQEPKATPLDSRFDKTRCSTYGGGLGSSNSWTECDVVRSEREVIRIETRPVVVPGPTIIKEVPVKKKAE